MESTRILTPSQAADRLQISTRQLRRLISDRGLPVIRTGLRQVRIREDLLEQWERQQTAAEVTCQSGETKTATITSKSKEGASDIIAASRKMQRRVTPSGSKQNSGSQSPSLRVV